MLENTFKYSFKAPIRENISLAVYNTGYQRCEPGYSWGPALRDHYLIHYVVSGRGRYTVAGKEFELSAGDIFLIYPSSVVSYAADETDPWEYYWVGFNGTEAKRLVDMTAFRKEEPVLNYSDYPDIKKLLFNIYSNRGAETKNEALMLGRLYIFLARLIELGGKDQIEDSISKRYLRQAIQFIVHNYCSNIDIEDIASASGISRSHLYRIFISEVGMAPSDYLTNYRINKACALLHESRFTVTEVANSVGYEDALYFSRVFKRIKGVSPTKYLHEAGGENGKEQQ